MKQFFHNIESAGSSKDLIQSLVSSSDLFTSISNDIIRAGNTFAEEDWIPDNNGLPVSIRNLNIETHMDVLMGFKTSKCSTRLEFRVCWIGLLHAVLDKDIKGASSLLIKVRAKFKSIEVSKERLEECASISAS
jgi:hypothetical protein